ncbi:hypothetical protein STIAU_8741 [Stigmatella aurantiaca DW4/3-1]|uniref:Uncharacterized protein n=1 Tax=Stigmatella aurantiaca (strain DW4/3-1) TaxID=378806 RepID=Q08UM4_STIAD|nr:hypothetical protein STIAU_8741 [Stigmatella aurantiaca DW4/3-1]
MLLGHGGQGLLDLLGQFPAQGALLGIGAQAAAQRTNVGLGHVHHLGLVELHRLAPRTGALADEIDADVDGDAVEPRVEGRVPLEVVQVLVNLDERLLRDVHRLLLVLEHAERDGIHLALVALDEEFESALVAVTNALDEGKVVGGQGGCHPSTCEHFPNKSVNGREDCLLAALQAHQQDDQDHHPHDGQHRAKGDLIPLLLFDGAVLGPRPEAVKDIPQHVPAQPLGAALPAVQGRLLVRQALGVRAGGHHHLGRRENARGGHPDELGLTRSALQRRALGSLGEGVVLPALLRGSGRRILLLLGLGRGLRLRGLREAHLRGRLGLNLLGPRQGFLGVGGLQYPLGRQQPVLAGAGIPKFAKALVFQGLVEGLSPLLGGLMGRGGLGVGGEEGPGAQRPLRRGHLRGPQLLVEQGQVRGEPLGHALLAQQFLQPLGHQVLHREHPAPGLALAQRGAVACRGDGPEAIPRLAAASRGGASPLGGAARTPGQGLLASPGPVLAPGGFGHLDDAGATATTNGRIHGADRGPLRGLLGRFRGYHFASRDGRHLHPGHDQGGHDGRSPPSFFLREGIGEGCGQAHPRGRLRVGTQGRTLARPAPALPGTLRSGSGPDAGGVTAPAAPASADFPYMPHLSNSRQMSQQVARWTYGYSPSLSTSTGDVIPLASSITR